MKSKNCRILVLAGIAILIMGQLRAQNLVQNIGGRERLSLNGDWNFIIDPYENGYYDYRYQPFDQSKSGKGGFYDNITQVGPGEKVEYNFDLEPVLQVPGDWNSQYEKLSLYEGTIWYRKIFKVETQTDKRYFLYFGAVNYEAHVYLNGKKLGSHQGGFTPFQFEVTGKLTSGENFVVVKVDNTRHKDAIPTVNTDWWNYGGITRDVDLVITPKNYISNYKVQLDPKNSNLIKGFIQLSDSAAGKMVKLSIPELNIQKEFKTDAEGKAEIQIPVKKINYWSPDNPHLYAVSLQSENDNVEDKIGFRTISTDHKQILLNGKPVFLKGISVHDENPLIPGRLRSEGDIRMILTWAKELGCNYIRLAHYTHNEKMLRLADEMGLMVWAEVPVYWTISWENQDTYNNAANQLTTGIDRDKNRASVIIWSIGNETPVTEPRNVFMGKLAALARESDDTRLIAAALEVKMDGYDISVDDPLGEKIDLASFNEYGGWYWGGNPSNLSKYHWHIKYDKPVVISEFGAGALAGYHGSDSTLWSEEYQANVYKNQIKMLEQIDGFSGMTPWILCDFRSPRRQHPYFQNFWNRKGLISSDGVKKQAFYVLQDYYRNK